MTSNEPRLKNGTWSVYKKSGAAQFSLIDPKHNDKGFVAKEGAIFLEAAPGVGVDADGNILIDWKRKISFAIGIPDIANLMDDNVKKHRLFHKTDTVTKTLHFVPATSEEFAGTFMMNLSDGKETVRVPFTAGEWAVLTNLLKAALPKMLGW